jgi:hypothetical protein
VTHVTLGHTVAQMILKCLIIGLTYYSGASSSSVMIFHADTITCPLLQIRLYIWWTCVQLHSKLSIPGAIRWSSSVHSRHVTEVWHGQANFIISRPSLLFSLCQNSWKCKCTQSLLLLHFACMYAPRKLLLTSQLKPLITPIVSTN